MCAGFRLHDIVHSGYARENAVAWRTSHSVNRVEIHRSSRCHDREEQQHRQHAKQSTMNGPWNRPFRASQQRGGYVKPQQVTTQHRFIRKRETLEQAKREEIQAPASVAGMPCSPGVYAALFRQNDHRILHRQRPSTKYVRPHLAPTRAIFCHWT
jgi:hypothetical protein